MCAPNVGLQTTLRYSISHHLFCSIAGVTIVMAVENHFRKCNGLWTISTFTTFFTYAPDIKQKGNFLRNSYKKPHLPKNLEICCLVCLLTARRWMRRGTILHDNDVLTSRLSNCCDLTNHFLKHIQINCTDSPLKNGYC